MLFCRFDSGLIEEPGQAAAPIDAQSAPRLRGRRDMTILRSLPGARRIVLATLLAAVTAPREISLHSRQKLLPGMLIKKPATRVKVPLVAFRQGHLLGPREVLRVSDHFVGGRF
jgi:hypothetical protein